MLLGTAALKADFAGKVEDGAAPGSLRGEPDGVEAVGGPRADFEGPIERAAEEGFELVGEGEVAPGSGRQAGSGEGHLTRLFRGAVCGVVGLPSP